MFIRQKKTGMTRKDHSWVGGWGSVTFVYCVETANDAGIVSMECQ